VGLLRSWPWLADVAAMAGPRHSRPRPSNGIRLIQHMVFIVKESRAFAKYVGTFPGADSATSGTIFTGREIPVGHTPDKTPRDIDHS